MCITTSITVNGADAGVAIETLRARDTWFAVEPKPDGLYKVHFTNDEGHQDAIAQHLADVQPDNGPSIEGTIDHAMHDDWYFCVVMADGRKYICGGMDDLDTPGFVHLRPCSVGPEARPKDFSFDGPDHPDAHVLIERGCDVNLAHVASVECGTS